MNTIDLSSEQQTLTFQQALDLAMQYHTAGDLSKAENIYQRILQTDPNHSGALHLLGVISHQAGENDRAVDLITKALIIKPDFVEAHSNLGAALKELGQLDEAVESYHKALSIKPNYAEAHSNLSVALQELGKLEEAVESCHKALDIKPDFAKAHNNLGLALHELERLDEALAHFHKAVDIKSDYAEAHNNLGNTLQTLERLDEAAPSYHKALEIKPDFADAHFHLGNTLEKLGRPDEALESYQNALVIKSDHSQAHNNLGTVLKGLGRIDEALTHYQKAIDINSRFSDAQYNLGNTLQDLGKLDEALAHYHKAIVIKPDYAEAHCNLGNALRALGRLSDAVDTYHKALTIKPHFSEAYSNLGLTLQALGQLDEAIVNYQKALDINPKFAKAHLNLGLILLMCGNYEEGWREYEWRWQSPSFPSTWRSFSYPQWRGEPVTNKTVLVWSEQGIGDEIMFANPIPDLLADGAKLVLECGERLVPLFARSFQAATVVARRDPPDKKIGEAQIDYQTPVASLCSYYRNTRESFQGGSGRYLTADPIRKSELRARYTALGDGPVIGICWRSGNPTAGPRRSAPLDLWDRILSQPNCSFVSLQYGEVEAELAKVKDRLGVEVHRDTEVNPLENAEDWFAQVAAMDLVISIDNSTIQVSGSQGIPTWTLLSYSPEWQFGMHGKDHDWHPSIRIYRQPSTGDWQSVFSEVLPDFADWLHSYT